MSLASIIIPACNEESLLPRTLRALEEAKTAIGRDLEIVVVDNASTDATAAVARSAGATVVWEPVRGIARARNAGAKASRGSLLVFVDADTVVGPATLAQALAAMESGDICGGGARITGDGPWQGAFARFLVWFWGWISRVKQLPAGSFVFCTREAFEAVGGFEEAVYAGEELWLGRRLKRWGKARGRGFLLVNDPPVVTSVRKGEMFGNWQLCAQFAVLLLFPWATRIRWCCWVWYRR